MKLEEIEKQYIGRRSAEGPTRALEVVVVVLRKGVEIDRYPLPHHVRHSPDGFNWGYGGSGPAELARCILLDLFVVDYKRQAELRSWLDLVYQAFKWDAIATLQGDRWTIESPAIVAWLKRYSDNPDHNDAWGWVSSLWTLDPDQAQEEGQ